MPTETAINILLRAHAAKECLARIKMNQGDPRTWAGQGARLWVNDWKNDCVLDVALGAHPRREAIEQLRSAGYAVLEVVSTTLFFVEKR